MKRIDRINIGNKASSKILRESHINEIGGVKFQSLTDSIQRLLCSMDQMKKDLIKTIIWVSIVQYLTYVGVMIGILNFVLRK